MSFSANWNSLQMMAHFKKILGAQFFLVKVRGAGDKKCALENSCKYDVKVCTVDEYQ